MERDVDVKYSEAIIYRITNIINGHSYIGQTIQGIGQRLKEHKSHCRLGNKKSKLYDAARKYGWDNFEVSVVEIGSFSLSELNELEKQWVQKEGYYNITSGGDGRGSVPVSQETREKIRKALTGRKTPEETKAKMRGKVWTEEQKQKLRDAYHRRGKEENERLAKARGDRSKGRIVSDEGRSNMSKGAKKLIQDNGGFPPNTEDRIASASYIREKDGKFFVSVTNIFFAFKFGINKSCRFGCYDSIEDAQHVVKMIKESTQCLNIISFKEEILSKCYSQGVSSYLYKRKMEGAIGTIRSKSGKYSSQINWGGVIHHLGLFDTKDEANSAFLKAKQTFSKTEGVA